MVLIRRSCVLCLTINFFALFIDRAVVFFNAVWVCKFGLWHSPCSMCCWLSASCYSTYLHEILSWVRGSCVFCLIVTVIALFIDISAVFCNIVLVCQSGLWKIPSNDTTAEEACCHVGNSGDRTFLGSSFPCAGEDFL